MCFCLFSLSAHMCILLFVVRLRSCSNVLRTFSFSSARFLGLSCIVVFAILTGFDYSLLPISLHPSIFAKGSRYRYTDTEHPWVSLHVCNPLGSFLPKVKWCAPKLSKFPFPYLFALLFWFIFKDTRRLTNAYWRLLFSYTSSVENYVIWKKFYEVIRNK